ncbi:hypothetical protein KI387_010717 [Taxus chinensis]|uniref:Protein kinase domain-containing protein n=1 Tax=Taxus chinensis TaxID=29808 RepID=A0AA38FN01_TAXCH|nr:hypothetical protein KI387_010717 [Taxus chinensis]
MSRKRVEFEIGWKSSGKRLGKKQQKPHQNGNGWVSSRLVWVEPEHEYESIWRIDSASLFTVSPCSLLLSWDHALHLSIAFLVFCFSLMEALSMHIVLPYSLHFNILLTLLFLPRMSRFYFVVMNLLSRMPKAAIALCKYCAPVASFSLNFHLFKYDWLQLTTTCSTFKSGVSTVGSALLIVSVAAYVRRSHFFKERMLRLERDNSRSISKVEVFLQNYVHEMPARYSYSQLKNITDNFRHKLGEGGFGVVYKGKLLSGILVAVKMLDQSRQSEAQFMNEVATIGRIHHMHLVRLLGYCFEGFKSALVYEYMANGSLDKFILARRKEKENTLSFQQLYSIALGAARGIAYLHDECHSRIIHFDIKPHNILLDEEFTAKVADFGLAKLCGKRDDHVSMTAARGTPGYIAPEAWSTNMGPVTDKSDVYGFGMMLLEMVGGRNNIDVQISRSSQFYFPEWAFKLIEKGQLRMRLRERDGRELQVADEETAKKMTKVGLWCIQYDSTHRPSMIRVVQMLEGDGDDISIQTYICYPL